MQETQSYVNYNVLADFDNKLKEFVDHELQRKYGKDWEQHKSEGCTLAVQVFGKSKQNRIREILGIEYKVGYRIENAQKRKYDKKLTKEDLAKQNESLKQTVFNLSQNLGLSIVEARNYVRKLTKF